MSFGRILADMCGQGKSGGLGEITPVAYLCRKECARYRRKVPCDFPPRTAGRIWAAIPSPRVEDGG